MAFLALTSKWDPNLASDWDNEKASTVCQRRMAHDLRQLDNDEKELRIYCAPDEQDVNKMQALIVGPPGTPYELGFFQYYVRVSPQNYPQSPPRVRSLTTGDGAVRFGPNLYAEGRICLSILGTFPGPSWTPAMNISCILKSIQSLMCDAALRNEPGYEKLVKTEPRVVQYDVGILHETIRVAVIDAVRKAMVKDSRVTLKFRRIILDQFVNHCEALVKKCQDHKKFDGQNIAGAQFMQIAPGRYRFGAMSTELLCLKAQVPDKLAEISGENTPEEAVRVCGEVPKEPTKEPLMKSVKGWLRS